MSVLVLAEAVLRCERRKLTRIAEANPVPAGLVIALVLSSPFLAYVLGGLAAPRLAVVTGGAAIATQFVFGVSLVAAAIAAAFALRMPAVGADLPQVASGGVSRVRVVLGARVLPVVPAAAAGAAVGLIAMARIASGSPGGWGAGVVWAAASGLIAAVALCWAAAARTGRASTFALSVLTSAALWAVLGLTAGGGAAAGPAGVAGRALAGSGSAWSVVELAVLALTAGWAAVWLLAAGNDREARRAVTRSRRLPSGPARAIAAASLLETLRCSAVRRPIAGGLLLAVAGPVAVGALTQVPPFVTLLLTGMTAAVAVVGLPPAIREAALKADHIWGGSAGPSVRAASLATCLLISVIPLAAVAVLTHAGAADLATGARPLLIGLIAAAVASRVIPPMLDTPFAHYAVYGLVNALLAVTAAAVTVELAGAIGAAVIFLVVTVPDRKAVLA